jgi:hypothetical protein
VTGGNVTWGRQLASGGDNGQKVVLTKTPFQVRGYTNSSQVQGQTCRMSSNACPMPTSTVIQLRFKFNIGLYNCFMLTTLQHSNRPLIYHQKNHRPIAVAFSARGMHNQKAVDWRKWETTIYSKDLNEIML